MKKDHIKYPFLAYANYPLKGNPKNLHKIFDSIERHYTVPDVSRNYIRSMVDTIIELSEYNDPEIVEKYRATPVINNANNRTESAEDIEFDEREIQKAMKILDMPREEAIKRLKSAESIESQPLLKDLEVFPEGILIPDREVSSYDDMRPIIDIAVEAVYGYRDGFCENRCRLRDLMIQKFGEDLFSGPERPKCYECHQIFFIHMLSLLTEGREYSQIPDLIYFLNDSHKKLKTELQIKSAPDMAIFREQFEEVVVFRAEDPFFFGAIVGAPPIAYKWIFRDFLYNFVANNLTEFILDKKNDRRKLKKCQQCKRYYIAKIVRDNQKYCSNKCKRMSKWSAERWRKYMETYRNRKRKKARSRQKIDEGNIQRMMNVLRITRQEAIEQIKEDEKM